MHDYDVFPFSIRFRRRRPPGGAVQGGGGRSLG